MEEELVESREMYSEVSEREGDQIIPADEEDAGSENDDLIVAESVTEPPPAESIAALKAVIEAAIYITDEPLAVEQIAAAVRHPVQEVKIILDQMVREYAAPEHGIAIRELAGGYKMATKPEHHDAIRAFVKNLQPSLKLSLAALETLAVVAYKQPITGPEIMEIRGVQGAGVLKTLLDRRLIATAGRKNVLGKPMQYKTTREFLIQFGLSSLSELPTLKEFEELGRLALWDSSDTGTVEANTSDERPTPVAAAESAAFETGATPQSEEETLNTDA